MTSVMAIDHLEMLRSRLDLIDSELISLLGQRFDTIRDVAEYKRDTGIAVMQPTRIGEVFTTRRQRAVQAGLDPKLVERLWTTIISHACQVENDVAKTPGGELAFQGIGFDHGLIEVDDLDTACGMICSRLSFEKVDVAGGSPSEGRTAVLRGGNVTVVAKERNEPAGEAGSPAYLAIEVHSLDATTYELKRRGNKVSDIQETDAGIRIATVHLGSPVHLVVRYVERPFRTSLGASDIGAPATVCRDRA